MFRLIFVSLCGVNDATGGFHYYYDLRPLIACCNRNCILQSTPDAKVRRREFMERFPPTIA
jgi:hypothetical protein